MGERDLTCYDIGCWLEVHELSTEDDGDPTFVMASRMNERLQLVYKL
jgi:hypothetical protein